MCLLVPSMIMMGLCLRFGSSQIAIAAVNCGCCTDAAAVLPDLIHSLVSFIHVETPLACCLSRVYCLGSPEAGLCQCRTEQCLLVSERG
jgi:hypothetical protein